MHILFLSDNFPPEVNAPASRTFEHTREWVRAGHRVTLITCAPNFPTGKIFPGYRNRLWQREEVDGIRVIRVWSYIAANEGFVRRIADYVSYMVTATLASLLVRRVDVVVATSPQFFTAVAGWMIGSLKRRPWVFELRDLWPESIRAVGAMKDSRLLATIERLELFLYRRATAIISVTEAFRRNLVARGIPAEKIHVITNGADLTRYRPMERDRDLVARLGLEGRFVLGYIGTMGLAHGLDTVLDAAQQLAAEPHMADARILMLGDGAQRAALKARAEREGINNVLFLDSVPKEDVTRYLSLLDASIIHLKRSDLFQTVIPSKLFECMAMGLPVLFGVEGEAADIVTRHNAGLLIEPDNAGAMAIAAVQLHNDASLRARLSRNGVAGARHFDRTTLARTMLARLTELDHRQEIRR